MKQPFAAEKVMVRYLLGEVSEKELEGLEREYFVQDDSFRQLLAVEDELIDACVAGELSPGERERFEKKFLSRPAGRQRVEFARALKRLLSEAPPAEAQATASEERASGRQSFASRLHAQKPARRLSLAAAVVLMLLGGSWLVVQSLRLRSELGQLRAERAMLQQRERELERQAAAQHARIDGLVQELARVRRQPGLLGPEAPEGRRSGLRIVSFLLTAGLTRDIGEPNRLRIPAAADRVQLRLPLQPAEYKSYHAALQTVEGREIWRRSSLKALPTPSGKAILLDLSAKVLAEGDYIVMLQGITPEGNFEDVNEYSFRVVKR